MENTVLNSIRNHWLTIAAFALVGASGALLNTFQGALLGLVMGFLLVSVREFGDTRHNEIAARRSARTVRGGFGIIRTAKQPGESTQDACALGDSVAARPARILGKQVAGELIASDELNTRNLGFGWVFEPYRDEESESIRLAAEFEEFEELTETGAYINANYTPPLDWKSFGDSRFDGPYGGSRFGGVISKTECLATVPGQHS